MMGMAWQEGYYDEIARLGEDWASHARYIALNPIRAGFVEEPEDWLYTGSVGYDLDLVLRDMFNA